MILSKIEKVTGQSIFALRLGGLGLRPPRYFVSFIFQYLVFEYRQNNAAQTPYPVTFLGNI